MKKNIYRPDDEIDLIALSKTIWHGKIKILIITIISFLVGIGYSYQLPNEYINSLNINKIDEHKLKKFYTIQTLINSKDTKKEPKQSDLKNQLDQPKQANESILKQFIYELKDYEEFLLSIKNTKKIKEQISKLKIADQKIELFKYARLLEIVEPEKLGDNYIINFKWHEPEEAKKVLQDTLNLAHNNLKASIHYELDLNMSYVKKLTLRRDRERLDFLKEQSSIARELKIKTNQINNSNLNQSNLSLNINVANIAYYLRGYQAIEKEIELIENRDYQNLNTLEQELNEFKVKDLDVKFIDYNVYLMNSKALKNANKIFVIFILLGLIIGVLYVLISNVIQTQTALKK